MSGSEVRRRGPTPISAHQPTPANILDNTHDIDNEEDYDEDMEYDERDGLLIPKNRPTGEIDFERMFRDDDDNSPVDSCFAKLLVFAMLGCLLYVVFFVFASPPFLKACVDMIADLMIL